MSDTLVQVSLVQQHDYRFEIQFGGAIPVLTGDEPAPLGTGLGPSPVQLLSAAVGNCLSDSLLFALRKFKQAPEPMRCDITSQVGRNPEGRLRVLAMTAQLTLGVPAASLQHLDRVLEQFEAFCTVTQSVGQGIPITIEISDSAGQRLK
ncbi:OsmC family protein [Polaromonas sp. AET17H-212]|uniref:OsmC family protein n=1 Tax=Polaromonas sp. AET17H-212 TaxID=1977061 RepID=UPI000BBCED9B|nr:OsmC family protein [Polaromonas sp. AET17H-212]